MQKLFKRLVPRFVNSLPYHVVPAQAGIQPQSNIDAQSEMDPRLRGDDNKEANLQDAPLDHDDCYLQDTRIDIWQYSLQNEFAEARSMLSKDELTRADRYYFPRHRRQFTIARATLRIILARYLNLPPSRLVFKCNEYGKPELVNASSLQFNLSHSGDLALLAIGKGQPLGVDVEVFSPRPYEGIGNQMFSSSENKALRKTRRSLKPLVFFHIWSQKEALIKACGLGLSYPTQQFDVPTLPITNQKIIDTLHKNEWHMVSFMPQPAYCVALCYHPMIKNIRYLALGECDLVLIKKKFVKLILN